MTIAINDAGEAVYLTDEGSWAQARTAVHPQTKEMLVFDGKGWVPYSQKKDSDFKQADDVIRSVAQGVTFGWADELAAGGNALLGSGTYQENLAQEQARNKSIPPSTGIPAEMAGGALSTLATAPVAGPLAALLNVSKLPRSVRAATGGTMTGAVYGAGEATPDSRAEGAVTGGAIGGTVGPVVAPVAAGLARTGRALRDATTPQANVSADLARAIERDAMTPQGVLLKAQELNRTRPGVATAADAGGENVKGLVERVAQTPGAGRTIVIPALTARQQGQMARLTNDLQTLTGTRQTATQAINDTMQQRATAAKPLYNRAFNFNARNVPEIVTAWQQATGTGWGQAVLRSENFKRNLQTEYGIKDPTNAPLMVVIDAWKKEVDGMVGEAIRSGNNNRARILGNLRDQVIKTVDQHNGAYKSARDAWAGPSRYLEAIEEGRNFLKTNISAEQLAAALPHMSTVEQEAFRIGAIAAIQGRMGNDPAKLGDMTKYLRSPEMRAKIAAIMPTPEAKAAWAKRLDFEVSSSELTGRALGNSATARRLAERQDADGIVGDLVMSAFAHNPPVGLLRQLVTAVPRRVRDTLRSRSDHILAELLTDPASMQGLVQAIQRVQARGNPPSPASLARATTAGTVSDSTPGLLQPSQGAVRAGAEDEER